MSHPREITVYGKKFRSVTDCYKSLGIPISYGRQLMTKYNVDTDSKALELYLGSYENFQNRLKSFGNDVEMISHLVRFYGNDYNSIQDLLDKYHLSDSFVRRFQSSNNISYNESLYYCILSKYYYDISDDSNTNCVCCTCMKCKKQFLFSPALVIKHVDECFQEDKHLIYFYKLLVSYCHLEDEFEKYYKNRDIDAFRDMFNEFFSYCDEQGLVLFTVEEKEYKSFDEFFKDDNSRIKFIKSILRQI